MNTRLDKETAQKYQTSKEGMKTIKLLSKFMKLLTSDMEFVSKRGIVSVVMSPRHAIWKQKYKRYNNHTTSLILTENKHDKYAKCDSL